MENCLFPVLGEILRSNGGLPPFNIRVVQCVARIGGKVQCTLTDGEQRTKLCFLGREISADRAVSL